MFKVLRFAFLVMFGLVGVAWKVLQTLASFAPDSRDDVPLTGEGRTLAGSIERIAYDDDGEAVGAVSGSPIMWR